MKSAFFAGLLSLVLVLGSAHSFQVKAGGLPCHDLKNHHETMDLTDLELGDFDSPTGQPTVPDSNQAPCCHDLSVFLVQPFFLTPPFALKDPVKVVIPDAKAFSLVYRIPVVPD